MKIGIVAGEASGDLLGAGLITALREYYPNLEIQGIGGEEMKAAGCESFFDMSALSVMGLVEPLFHLPELFKIRRFLYSYFSKNRPDVFIGIDSPDFNLGLEMKLRALKIPVLHYVSPSVWAWRQKRIHKIARAVDHMLTLLPFEASFYEKHQVPVTFVGHPLADKIPLIPDKKVARQHLGLDSKSNYVAILPGSRANEIKYLAEVFLQTAQEILRKKPGTRFITSCINEKRKQEFIQTAKRVAPELTIHFFEKCSHEVLTAADVVLVTSGTATLETMLFKRPMVIAYRMANITYRIARRIVKVPFFGLPNLLANQLLVPEFVQDAVDPKRMSEIILDYLNHPEKVIALENTFTKMHENLKCNASQKAAAVVKRLLTNCSAE